jgi:hypothetical protein
MELKLAKEIGRKERAFRHCTDVLNDIDKHGSTVVKLNCTGVTFNVTKGDPIYLRFQTVLAQLREELAAYKVTTPKVAPYGACDSDAAAAKRAKKNAYMREYMRRKREAAKK